MSSPSPGFPRILFVADSPGGGAGIAALRLCGELKRIGMDVRFLVYRDAVGPIASWNTPLELDHDAGFVRKARKLGGWIKEALATAQRWSRAAARDRFFHGVPDAFEITTITLGKEQLEAHPWFAWADVIHLHWAAGFLAPRQRWTEKHWVISLHDANPFTAVCHFPADCIGFESGCRVCPQLAGTRNPRWSGRIFDAKWNGYGTARGITLHAPSQWIAGLASRSLLTRGVPTVVLANLVPTGVFRLMDHGSCRDLLGLSADRKIGLFVAGSVGNVRKGFHWFVKLAESLSDSEWDFVIIGDGDLPPLPAHCRILGKLNDPRLMAAAYNAADVFISSALQDNLPSTIMEAQLCGTPVVGFAVGGQPEMLVQGETGFLARDVGLTGLLAGLEWYRTAGPARETVAAWAADRWNQQTLLSRWVKFYQELL